VHPLYWKTQPHDRVLDRLAQDVDAALGNRLFVIIEYKVIGWPDSHYEIPTWGGPKDTYDSSFTLTTSVGDAVAKRRRDEGRSGVGHWNEDVAGTEEWG